MKNRVKIGLKTGLLAFVSLLLITACSPQDNDDHSLGPIPSESQLAFTASPTSEKANILALKNESVINGVATWDLGNGGMAKGSEVNAEYPFAGEYTITMTLYTTGSSASISKVIVIEKDDMSLLDTPMYNALTGGADNLEGKTWVFDQYVSGHFGVGPADGSAPDWWSAPAEAKEGSSLYTQEFTFIQVGVKLSWKNNGYIYTNEAGKNALGGDFIENPGGVGDFDVKYTPKESYTFSLDETNKTITLNDGAFFGFYTGSSTYEILSLTKDEFYLKNVSAVEGGNAWWFRFVPKEKNIKPDITVPLKGIVLAEDFENEDKPAVLFGSEDMGPLFSTSYQNPMPLPINESGRVFLYQKSEAFYSNVFYVADGYKFDLTEINKVRLKVMIPSWNDYTTANTVAGDWITNNLLKPQLEVKLQDSSKGGNAWETQTTIVKDDLELNKWIELEFDFSHVKDRKDYDKIVIQFGAEGHSGSGIFYFDDFSFNQ